MIGIEEFREKATAWLSDNAELFSTASGQVRDPLNARRFRSALWDAGLLGIALDPAYGGEGLTDAHQAILDEEVARYALPPLGEVVTTGICAPILLDFGTEEQKRNHLREMFRGEKLWTQLLSEPGAGSDLGNVQTKAVHDGNQFVVTGQKVWTSNAMIADLALCIVRTRTDVPKRRGLSMLIVDLRSEGVTIRPLRQMNGDAHFSEVFLDSVRVPVASLVGTENDGWRILLGMLAYERYALGAGVKSSGSGKSWVRPASEQFLTQVRQRGINNDALVRQELVKVIIAEKLIAYLGQKMRDERSAGITVGAKGSLTKLASAQLARQSASLGMVLVGAFSQAWNPSDKNGGAAAMRLTTSPMFAIAGGTSEIQRNAIGEQVLGLPREPQAEASKEVGSP
jgi:alkylation response protein AidB-like acyl-CoA dehydrogenase